jgi:hypothetical protein
MSLMFPTIFTIAIHGLDKQQTQLGSSLIVMSIIGGAILTPMMGLLADQVGINAAYAVPMVAFGVVTAYAWAERHDDDAALVAPPAERAPEEAGGPDFLVGAARAGAAPSALSKAVVKEGKLKKLGGKDKDKWQERKVSVSAREIAWEKGLGQGRGTLAAAEVGSASVWSALDMPEGFGFEVASRVKDGKVYKFVAASEVERDNWIDAICGIIGDINRQSRVEHAELPAGLGSPPPATAHCFRTHTIAATRGPARGVRRWVRAEAAAARAARRPTRSRRPSRRRRRRRRSWRRCERRRTPRRG